MFVKLLAYKLTGFSIKLRMQGLTDGFAEFFTQIMKDHASVRILKQHAKTYARERTVILRETILFGIPVMCLQELYGLRSDENSRVLGGLTFKLIGTSNRWAVQFAGAQLHSPCDINCSTDRPTVSKTQ